MIFGYHRTSTKEQHLDRGIHEIEEYCRTHNLKLEKIFADQYTGKSFDRPRYTVLKEDILRTGDTLIITELDRLGRDKNGIIQELRYFADKGIRVMILEIPTTTQDFSSLNNTMAELIMTAINNVLIEMYAAMAQAEMEKKVKRQQEGIAAMKARGEWDRYGRPRIPKPDGWDQVIKLWDNGDISGVEAMRRLGLKKSTFYKLIREEKRMDKNGDTHI